MKSIIAALVILSSSLSFAQATAPAQPQLSVEEVQLYYFLGCSVERFCAAGTQSEFDTAMLSFKGEVEKNVAGVQCSVFELDTNEAAAKADLAAIATAISADGTATCLSAIEAAPLLTPATPVAP